MTLKDIFIKEFDMHFAKIEKFDIFEFEKYFNKEDKRYKHILGVAANMQALAKQLKVDEDDFEDLMNIAYLHDIGYSRRVKNRGLHALDGAVFAIEKGFSEEVALAVMFHTAADGEAHLTNGDIDHLYKRVKVLLVNNEKAKYYIDLITLADLRTEHDGTPTRVSERVFKILARYEKGSIVYKNIHAHKKYFKQLEKRILLDNVKDQNIFERLIDVVFDRTNNNK